MKEEGGPGLEAASPFIACWPWPARRAGWWRWLRKQSAHAEEDILFDVGFEESEQTTALELYESDVIVSPQKLEIGWPLLSVRLKVSSQLAKARSHQHLFAVRMRHRLGNKRLGRGTAHRMMLLRNLVSSLVQHEAIETTVAKATEAKRMADKMITLGKKGSKPSKDAAGAFMLNRTETMVPLFNALAKRYEHRQGGYTRVRRIGHRIGDRAPLAVLELVDGPKDSRYEFAARAVGRELALQAREAGEHGKGTWWQFRRAVELPEQEDKHGSQSMLQLAANETLDPTTRKNIVKALAFRKAYAATEETIEDVTTITASPDSPQASTSTSVIEAQEPNERMVRPTSEFLDLCHSHYLRQIASLSASTPVQPVPYQQLTGRLRPSPNQPRVKPVVTLPVTGRRAQAGESTRGWVEPQGNAGAGPLGRAKGANWLGTFRRQYSPPLWKVKTGKASSRISQGW